MHCCICSRFGKSRQEHLGKSIAAMCSTMVQLRGEACKGMGVTKAHNLFNMGVIRMGGWLRAAAAADE